MEKLKLKKILTASLATLSLATSMTITPVSAASTYAESGGAYANAWGYQAETQAFVNFKNGHGHANRNYVGNGNTGSSSVSISTSSYSYEGEVSSTYGFAFLNGTRVAHAKWTGGPGVHGIDNG